MPERAPDILSKPSDSRPGRVNVSCRDEADEQTEAEFVAGGNSHETSTARLTPSPIRSGVAVTFTPEVT